MEKKKGPAPSFTYRLSVRPNVLKAVVISERPKKGTIHRQVHCRPMSLCGKHA